jgi:pimeloyl-ACP methyl ester carboxylesterase
MASVSSGTKTRFAAAPEPGLAFPMTLPRPVCRLIPLLLALLATALRGAAPAAAWPGEERLAVGEHRAFLIPAPKPPESGPRPWVWYAPTLPNLPGGHENWLFTRLLAAGVSVAGVDVGESYGNAAGRAGFDHLHALLAARGYSSRPALLARSRGGLMLLSWAAENPRRVAAFAGIYPVCNLASYPGLPKAAPAYGLTAEALAAELPRHNPVDRLAPLAGARVPLLALHGDQDRLVPLAGNSALLHARYTALGGPMELLVVPGQGHSLWSGFFEDPRLLAFLLRHTLPHPPRNL